MKGNLCSLWSQDKGNKSLSMAINMSDSIWEESLMEVEDTLGKMETITKEILKTGFDKDLESGIFL